jgi:hypothetical protein
MTADWMIQTELGRRAPWFGRDFASASTARRVFGYAKQGASYGYTKVKGLHPLLAVASTPTSAPLVVACRLREGRATAARGAASFVAEALAAARRAGDRVGAVPRRQCALLGGGGRQPRDTVCDPDCGAGTVVAEAVRARRHAIGITGDPHVWEAPRAALTAAKARGAPGDGMILDELPDRRSWTGLGPIDLVLTAIGPP